ncbi:MAG: pantetheine-phosphate adenylyltransferase [Bacteroidetes bacterium]|nr:pantetheine-phosphate adenylyltransferase [Bacteroidota bacterium]
MAPDSRRLALYPGSFDPFTYGHLDIVKSAVNLFDQLEITVAINSEKQGLLSVGERCEIIRETVADLPSVVVVPFEGLLVNHARRRGASALVRGLRQVSDFDYEFRMAFANRKLAPEIETVLLLTSEEHAFTSSSIVRDVLRWGGDISHFVPPTVARALEKHRSGK